MYQGPVGSSVAVADMVEKIQKLDFAKTQSANPATLEQARGLEQLLRDRIGDAPEWMTATVGRPGTKVVGIGGFTCMFRLASLVIGRTTLTKQDLWTTVERLLGKTDDELKEYPEAPMVVCKAVLGYTVMDMFGIEEFQYEFTNGGCPGVLLSAEFW